MSTFVPSPENPLTPTYYATGAFAYGNLRSLWVQIYVFLAIWTLLWILEFGAKYQDRRRQEIPIPGKEMGLLEKPKVTFNEKWSNSLRVTRDAFILILVGVIISQNSQRAWGGAIALLWTQLALFAVWSLSKLAVDNAILDLLLGCTVMAVELTVFGIAFRGNTGVRGSGAVGTPNSALV